MNNRKAAQLINPDLQPSAVLGQSTGVIILATGGFVWLFFATFHLRFNFGVYLLYATLIAAAVKLRLDAKRLGVEPPPETQSAGRDKVLLIATVAEGAAIFASLIIMQLLGHAEYFIPAIALCIGLHFIPLAYAFQRPLLFVAAMGLCLVAVLVPLLIPLPRALPIGAVFHSSWMLWCGVGSGVILWATAVAQLIRARGVLNGVAITRL